VPFQELCLRPESRTEIFLESRQHTSFFCLLYRRDPKFPDDFV
jgi:hypothetical protein